VLGTPAGRTWVKLRALQRGRYAESGGADPELRPVFVSVLKARRPPPSEIEEEARRLTEALAEALGRPMENVHVIYEAGAAGRVAFGGQLVRAQV
jgi:phenylpyruvate tautomerase PptA (4-oxalocrotonate tautomerase family)